MYRITTAIAFATTVHLMRHGLPQAQDMKKKHHALVTATAAKPYAKNQPVIDVPLDIMEVLRTGHLGANAVRRPAAYTAQRTVQAPPA